MEQNYDITSLDFSLESLSAVKVVCHIIEASRSIVYARIQKDLVTDAVDKVGRFDLPSHMRSLVLDGIQEDVVVDAMDRVGRSDLPPGIREMLGNLIKPVKEELRLWYLISGPCISPVWTPQGTVDAVASAKAIQEDESVFGCWRFMLACNLCDQERMLEISKELFDEEVVWLEAQSRMAEFWLRACLADSQLDFNEGFRLALEETNEFAIRRFIEKASPEEVRSAVENALDSDDGVLKCFRPFFSPATYVLLFSKLNEIQPYYRASSFSTLLLNALLKRPYQHLFLPAARSLMSLLDSSGCFDIMLNIATRIKHGYRDCDYRTLYIEFWKLGDLHRPRPSTGAPTSTWPLETSKLDVIMLMEDSVVNFMLRQLPAEVKEALLLDFPRNDFCDKLLSSRDYRRLEQFVRGCGMHSRALLVTLKSSFVPKCPNDGWKARRFLSHYSRWDKSDWENVLVRFAKMMDELIADAAVR